MKSPRGSYGIEGETPGHFFPRGPSVRSRTFWKIEDTLSTWRAVPQGDTCPGPPMGAVSRQGGQSSGPRLEDWKRVRCLRHIRPEKGYPWTNFPRGVWSYQEYRRPEASGALVQSEDA